MSSRSEAAQPNAPLSAVRLSAVDVLGLGLAGLRTRPLRAALSALGIAAGITTLVLIVGISSSSNSGLNDRLNALGANLLLAQAQSVGNTPTRLVPHAQAMALRIGPVSSSAALAQLPQVVRRNSLIPSADITGLNAYATTPALIAVLRAQMRAGSFLNPDTAEMHAVVLGSAAASNLAITAAVLKDHPEISIGAASFTVVGILEPMPVTSGLNYGVFTGWSAARAILRFDGRATSVYVRTDPGAIGPVSQVLGPTILPQAPGLVNVSQPSTALAAKDAVNSAASALVLGLVGVALIIGGISIANTMYVVVVERRREIGLRRALGATKHQILTQFLVEAAVLAAIGSFAGVSTGVIASAVYATYQGLPVANSAAAIAGGLIGGIAIGVLAGLYPALRAANLTPTEALASS
jgi:putative ABC transport system permease protein